MCHDFVFWLQKVGIDVIAPREKLAFQLYNILDFFECDLDILIFSLDNLASILLLERLDLLGVNGAKDFLYFARRIE